MASLRSFVPVTAVYRVSLLLTAAMVASSTALGGGKSGSPTHRLVTFSPDASISFTVLNTSMVLLSLMFDSSGFGEMGEEEDEGKEVDVGLGSAEPPPPLARAKSGRVCGGRKGKAVPHRSKKTKGGKRTRIVKPAMAQSAVLRKWGVQGGGRDAATSIYQRTHS